jgi:hypothetical protein
MTGDIPLPKSAGTELQSSVPLGVCEADLSGLPSTCLARTNVNDRRAAWLNQFR